VIRYENAEFCAPELGAVETNGAEVEIRVDPEDYGRIFVFDRAGTFVCVAINPERQGVDRRAVALATQAVEKATKKQARQQWREAQRQAGGDHRQLVEQLMAGKLAEAEKITALPEPVELIAPRAIEEMGKALAAAADLASSQPAPTAAEMEQVRQTRRIEAVDMPVIEESDQERYIRLVAAERSYGHAPAGQDAVFVEWFRATRMKQRWYAEEIDDLITLEQRRRRLAN